jgi:CRISPR-associated protein Cmr2
MIDFDSKWVHYCLLIHQRHQFSVDKAFWQAKLNALLRSLDPAYGASLSCMGGYADRPADWREHVALSSSIAQASDRAAIAQLPLASSPKEPSIRHLLSGEQRSITFCPLAVADAIPDTIKDCEDPRRVYWWFWRCYPEVLARRCPDSALTPADPRIPDASIWSQSSMTSALAGSLAGYYSPAPGNPEGGQPEGTDPSRPQIAIFSFTPVQDLIKASRKLRDFWAGSWLLHYLSAKVCWEIAKKYGPDSLLYPCLYSQPLIDYWLLKQYPDFEEWIADPTQDSGSLDLLLTAGFPNVLVMVLPNNGVTAAHNSSGGTAVNPVRAVMALAEQVVRESWQEVSGKVLAYLRIGGTQWQNISQKTWEGWLSAQWQSYWTALPLGDCTCPLQASLVADQDWTTAQNKFAQLNNPETPPLQTSEESTPPQQELFNDQEAALLDIISRRDSSSPINIGSWWAPLFDRVRGNLASIKTARHWRLPTAFGPRSTISGMGPVVTGENLHHKDWSQEGETQDFWQQGYGLFDGREQLNATEVVKRGLHKICLDLLGIPGSPANPPALYPDLCSGAAGWLRTLQDRYSKGDQSAGDAINHYQSAGEAITQQFKWCNRMANELWGIPWVDRDPSKKWLHPRLLNAGWLIDDLASEDTERATSERQLGATIDSFFAPGRNPTDWYVLAAGDGDGMSDWLRGIHLDPYRSYVDADLLVEADPDLQAVLNNFLAVRKRMGPGTHSALSRALLDFSNQLVPYLTEQRYAGRLIYGGGDDVLAYTNLWEWDSWLWDIRECFRGHKDPRNEFCDQGDYWQWKDAARPPGLAQRPLFTMGQKATISFGLVIANQGVPLAIALENLWEAEEGAKEHKTPAHAKKDAVQIRVLYGNGNILQATAKFGVFNQWRSLLQFPATHPHVGFDPALFEQAAELWKQHPVPSPAAISPWVWAFCSRRDLFKGQEAAQEDFRVALAGWLAALWETTEEPDRQIQNWLKLAAFVLRKRDIRIKTGDRVYA